MGVGNYNFDENRYIVYRVIGSFLHNEDAQYVWNSVLVGCVLEYRSVVLDNYLLLSLFMLCPLIKTDHSDFYVFISD